MSRLRRLCQCLTLVGCWQLALAPVAWAQPTLLAEHKNARSFDAGYLKSVELPGHRFGHCGSATLVIPGQSWTKHELTLVVSKASGDTVRYRKLNLNLPRGGDYFVDVVVEPDYGLTYLSGHLEPNPNPALPSIGSYALTQIDTLGVVRWQRRYPTTNVSAVTALLRVPDGYLVLVNGVSAASTPTATFAQAGVAKFDRLGAPLWQRSWPSRGYGGVGLLSGLVARPDGSYLASGYCDNGTPYTGGAALPRFDTWLVQFTAWGDTLHTARFGVNGQFETAYHVYNTRDGGAALSGARLLAGAGAVNDAQLVKVDSLLRPQWTYTQPNLSTYAEFFGFVQPTRRGDILFGSRRLDYAAQELWVEFNTYTAGGVPRWSWRYNFAGNAQRPTSLATLVSSADSSAYVAGITSASATSRVYEDCFARFANVGAPYVADLCRVPPRAQFGWVPTAGGDSLRLVSVSTAGPRYAVLALWHWDFGDGTGYDGPAPPPHRYPAGAGAGTRLTLTVTNNLGCTSAQVAFPFALAPAAGRALAAGAQLFPNPTAGPATLVVPGLRAQGPAAVAVVNALGQVVRAQSAAVHQGTVRAALDLGGLPPGVYAVRLCAAEGTVVQRVVMQ